MKKNGICAVSRFILVLMLIAVLPIMTGCGKKATDTITLNFITDSGGMTGYNKGALEPWFAEVDKMSNGRIKINILVGSMPSTELYDAVVNGAGDLSIIMTMYNPGRFPATDLATISDIGVNCERVGQAFYDMWKQSPEIEKEFSAVKLIGFTGTPPTPPGLGFGTVKKPIRKLEDLKGLKIGAMGNWSMKIAKALGAVPVTLPPPAVYEGLQRGIVDASFFDASMLVDWKFMEVVKYYHLASYQYVPMPLFVNLKSWEKLPADVQQILLDAAAKLPKYGDDYNIKACNSAIEKAKEAGVEIISYSPEELARWQTKLKPIKDQYIAELKAKGIDGNQMVERWNSICKKYVK